MVINTNATLLSSEMTNKEWQEYFSELKKVVEPANRRTMPSEGKKCEYSDWHTGVYPDYYATFINDILSNIRHGIVDTCSYIYQIADILRYEPNIIAYWNAKKHRFDVCLPL